MSNSATKTIPPNEHVFVGGQTGSGKSFLTRKYLAGYPYVAVLDTKGTVEWPEVPAEEKTLITRLEELPNVETPKIIYRPRWEELSESYYNAFFQWVYRRGNTVVWVDEAMSVSPNPLRIPEWYKACLTRGRELGIGVWSLSQRPAKIALEILSESRHFFIFRLNLAEDRKRLREITGANNLLRIPPRRFAFWYYNEGQNDAVLAKLTTRNREGSN